MALSFQKMDVNVYQQAIQSLTPDATLLDRDGTPYPVHSFLLSACSPVFRAMFQSGMKEGLEKTIQLDVPPETLVPFLRSLYPSEGERSTEEPSEALKLEELFCSVQFYDQYHIDAQPLQQHILAYVTEDTILSVLDLYFLFSNSNVALLHALLERLKAYLTFNHKLSLLYENAKFCNKALDFGKALSSLGLNMRTWEKDLICNLVEEHDALSCHPILEEKPGEETFCYDYNAWEEENTFSSVEEFLRIHGGEKAWLLRMKLLYIPIQDYEHLWELPLEPSAFQILFSHYEPVFPEPRVDRGIFRGRGVPIAPIRPLPREADVYDLSSPCCTRSVVEMGRAPLEGGRCTASPCEEEDVPK